MIIYVGYNQTIPPTKDYIYRIQQSYIQYCRLTILHSFIQNYQKKKKKRKFTGQKQEKIVKIAKFWSVKILSVGFNLEQILPAP